MYIHTYIGQVMLYCAENIWKKLKLTYYFEKYSRTSFPFCFSPLLFPVLFGGAGNSDLQKGMFYSWLSFRKCKAPNNHFTQNNFLNFYWSTFPLNSYSLLNCNDLVYSWLKSAKIHRTVSNTHFKPQCTEKVETILSSFSQDLAISLLFPLSWYKQAPDLKKKKKTI